MRIVLAPDKFKSTLDARAVARALAAGVKEVVSGAECIECPLADGGEGSTDVLLQHLGGRRHEVSIHGPDDRRLISSFASLDDGRAVVEMAQASGATLMEKPDALGATSRGTGELIAAAAVGSDRVVVFVGGSASTDGGTGAARPAGWEFLDKSGRSLPVGGGALRELADLRWVSTIETTVVGACDVTNPLIGPAGAARVFGPQKGASLDEIAILEEGLERLAHVVDTKLGVDVATIAHGGAGGGMGAGLSAFFGARLTSGFEIVASAAGLEEALTGADLVITGEGRLDTSSFSGKVVSGVLELARKNGVPCAAVVGTSEVPSEIAAARGLDRVVTLEDVVGDSSSTRAAVARAAQLVIEGEPEG
ncbi:MAG: glycerate 2-kinase [Actinomycetota bacterium]|nr:glycerate 2-kinase [Actinomycetota bacterium]